MHRYNILAFFERHLLNNSKSVFDTNEKKSENE